MRFVVVGSMDPNDPSFFSGTSLSFISSLRQHGHEVATIGPLQPEMPLLDRIKTRVYRHALDKFYQVDRNPSVLRRRARHANAQLRTHPNADAVIVLYPPDGAFLETTAPLICIHDATWHLLLDYYPPDHDRRRIPAETLKGGYTLDRLGFANCDRAILSSQWAAESAIRDGGIDPGKVVVLNFGVNLAAPPEREDVEQWLARRGEGRCRLLFVGYSWQRKGGDIAFAAARSLHDRGIAVELQVVGCRPPIAETDFVTTFGQLSKKDPKEAAVIERLFSEADFLILPTRADCHPMVLCEAAAYGVPVVTSDTGGIGSIVRDESWGIALACDAPPEAYANWIASAFGDRARYRNLARAARREYDERLNWGAFIRGLCDVVAAAPRPRGQQVASLAAPATYVAQYGPPRVTGDA